MAPMQDYQQQQNEDAEQNPALTIDWHMSAPWEVDFQQQHPLIRLFHEFCAITNMGTRLRTIEKCYGENGEYIGHLECSLPLPDMFVGKWCRLFYRAERTYVFVMDQNNQDFAIIDFQHGTTEGCWTLFDALPDNSVLKCVEVHADDNSYRLVYTLDDNEHSTMEYGFGFPIPGQLVAIH
jgi:hypothetical protein